MSAATEVLTEPQEGLALLSSEEEREVRTRDDVSRKGRRLPLP